MDGYETNHNIAYSKAMTKLLLFVISLGRKLTKNRDIPRFIVLLLSFWNKWILWNKYV